MANEDKPWLNDPIIRPLVPAFVAAPEPPPSSQRNPVGDELGNIYTPQPPPSLGDMREAAWQPAARPAAPVDPSAPPGPLAAPVGGEFGDLSAQPWAQGEPVPEGKIAPVAKIGSAMAEGWRATPQILTPEAEEGQRRLWGPIMGGAINNLYRGGTDVLAAGNALMYGVAEGANQITGDPRAGRDALMIQQLLPMASRPGPRQSAVMAERAATPPPTAEPPRFVSEHFAPNVSELDPRNAIETLIRHDNAENPPPAPDRGAPNQGTVQATETPPVPAKAPPVVDEAPLPGTSAYAKQVASAYYDIADKSGGTLTPQVTNKFVDAVEAAGKQTKAGKITAGENPVSSLAGRLQELRDEPLTLRAAQEIDEALGDLIDKEHSVTGLSKDGTKLVDVQSKFRDMIENAGEGDITGGTTGFDALGPARKAWSQARKMDDLERIQQRAELTDNPATSVRTQIRTLLSSKTKSRGYSPEELAALKEAADRGVVGSALHVFGSRLVPLVAGGAGLASGPVTAAAMAGAAHVVGAGLRAGATGIQTRRLNRAIGTIGEGVPPNPLAPPPGQIIPPDPRNKMSPLP
jgi:hypothetical protein